MQTRHRIVCSLALTLAICVRFYPTLETEFVYEDARLIPGAQAPAPSLPNTAVALASRPLTLLTWWAQVQQGPRLMHLTNIGLHLLVMLLLVLLTQRLGATEGTQWLVAVVFALHPLSAEAVNYAAGRSELLAAAAIVAACLLAITDAAWLAVPVLALGIMSKESAVAGLVLLPLTVAAWRRWTWAPLALTVVALVVVMALSTYVAGLRSMVPVDGWVLTQATYALRMVGLLLWPWGQSVDHDLSSVPAYAAQAGAVLFGIGLYRAWMTRHESPLLLYGLLLMTIALVPRFMVQPQVVGGSLTEHQFYPALPGAVLALVAVVRPAGGYPSSVC